MTNKPCILRCTTTPDKQLIASYTTMSAALGKYQRWEGDANDLAEAVKKFVEFVDRTQPWG